MGGLPVGTQPNCTSGNRASRLCHLEGCLALAIWRASGGSKSTSCLTARPPHGSLRAAGTTTRPCGACRANAAAWCAQHGRGGNVGASGGGARVRRRPVRRSEVKRQAKVGGGLPFFFLIFWLWFSEPDQVRLQQDCAGSAWTRRRTCDLCDALYQMQLPPRIRGPFGLPHITGLGRPHEVLRPLSAVLPTHSSGANTSKSGSWHKRTPGTCSSKMTARRQSYGAAACRSMSKMSGSTTPTRAVPESSPPPPSLRCAPRGWPRTRSTSLEGEATSWGFRCRRAGVWLPGV